MAPWHVGDIFDSIEDKYSFWDSLLNYVLDEHAPFKKLRVRAQDVPYMTSEWKRAIRNKRKFSKQFSKNRTQLNLELKNKWRNEATKLRRKSIKSYWQKVCNNLNSNPKQFYNTFNPFLNHKKDACTGNNITLNVNGKLETNQETVAEHLADYFSTMADNIGGTDILNLREEDFSAHVCVQNIKETLSGSDRPPFTFSSVQPAELIKEMESLNANKASGHDGLPPKGLTISFHLELTAPTLSNDLSIVESMNDFFSSVFTSEDCNNFPEFEYVTNCKLSNILCNTKEVEKLLRNLNIYKSPGPDSLPPRILKECASVLSSPLCFFFNKSFSTGKLPHLRKLANITPLFKKGSKTARNNYRQISSTSIVCKIAEKIVKS